MEAYRTATELQGTRLKDRRRVNTFIRTAAALYQQPQASLSAALGDGLRQAAGDLFRHPDTRVAALLAGHGAATTARCQAAGRVIVAQDTTYFTYHQAQIVGLGPLNGRAQGLVGHSALALSPEGLPLGVLALRVWGDTAHPLPGYPVQLEPEVCACESAKWIVTLKDIQIALPAEIPVLVVADREADLTAYLRAPRRPGVDWLIRAVGTRTVHGSAGATGQPAPDGGTWRRSSLGPRCWASIRSPCRPNPPSRAARRSQPAPPVSLYE